MPGAMRKFLQPGRSVTAEKIQTWRKRLHRPRKLFMNLGVRQNWSTFAMNGEGLRQQEGFISDGVP